MRQQNDSSCIQCQSENQHSFTGELALHFPGLDGLQKPVVWVFPKVSVCLNCGYAEFPIPENELEVLRTGAAVEGAIISWEPKSDKNDD